MEPDPRDEQTPAADGQNSWPDEPAAPPSAGASHTPSDATAPPPAAPPGGAPALPPLAPQQTDPQQAPLPHPAPPRMPDAMASPLRDPGSAAAFPMEPAGPVASEPAMTRPDPAGAPLVQATSPAEYAGPSEPEPLALTPAEAAAAVEPQAEADWLDRICPYLLSEDGTWRSTQPDGNHRCTAQDPPGTLPLAFQERFCLTDRHDRCEMYKYAHSARSASLEQEGIPAKQVEGARFKPSVRSVPLALGPRDGASSGGGSGGPGRRRPLYIAIAIGAGVAILYVVLLLLSGSDGSGTAPDPSASAAPQATAASTLQPTARPTPAPTTAPGATPATTTAPPVTARNLVRYEVQEDEALKKIGESFGVSRQRIIRANEGMADKAPYVVAGDVILVPLSDDISEETIQQLPGYIEFVDAP